VGNVQLVGVPETAIAYFIGLIVMFPDINIRSGTVFVNDRVHKIRFRIDNELWIW
jgi:hypothetical protein